MTFEEFIGPYEDIIHSDPCEIRPNGIFAPLRKGALEQICVLPVIPVCIYTNADTGIEKVELAFLKCGHKRTKIYDRSIIANKNKIIQLADDGLEINSNNSVAMVTYLADTIAKSMDYLPKCDSKSVLGWTENGDFLPFKGQIAFDGEENYRYLFKSVGAKGTLEEWIEGIAPLRKNLPLRLCMATSFASPLIELIGENCFITHLWGGTGVGKSVALLVAMSIWGNPAFGKLTRTMNMTVNSMLSTAAFLKNLPFAGDELQTIKTNFGNYDRMIMQITEGVNRGRMSYDKINETQSWKCAFLFSGEEPCVKSDSGGGAMNRVIQIEVSEKLVENGNKTACFVKSHYGSAALPYLEAVLKADVQQMYYDLMEEITTAVPDTTDKQAGAMALMMCGDEIARQTFFPEEEKLTVSMVREYLLSALEVDVAERAYKYLTGAIAENSVNFNGVTGLKNWGQIISEGGRDICYVIKNVLERLLNDGGYDFNAVKKKWAERGRLERHEEGGNMVYRWRRSFGGYSVDCVKIVMPSENGEDEVGDDGLPF